MVVNSCSETCGVYKAVRRFQISESNQTGTAGAGVAADIHKRYLTPQVFILPKKESD